MAKKTTTTKPKSIDNISLEMGKVPPQAVDVEEIVLGAMLIEPSVIQDVMGVLSAECFYKEINRKIFEAISSLQKMSYPVDIFTVAEELKGKGDLELIGGPVYLGQLSSRIGAAAHIDYHVKILVQKYIQRELISIANEVQRDSFDDALPVDDLLDSTQQKIFTLAERNMRKETQKIEDIVKEAIDDIESYQNRGDGLSGVASGYIGIDRMTLGWQSSDLIILAARPSVGKTAFVLTMARNMAVEYKTPIAFFSLEMAAKQLVKRLIVAETGLSSEKVRGGSKMADHEWTQLNVNIKKLAASPIYVDDTPSLSIYEFRSKARKLVKSKGVKLIIIDYLQLMTGPPELKGMREQEVSTISRSLKAIAKELDIPIIALSQMSRQVEMRGGNKRPQLSDLRESGAIEQDADLVLFIHRPDYYGLQEEDPTQQGLAEIIIAKHRNGAVGDVKMRFIKNEAKFVDANDLDYSQAQVEQRVTYSSSMNMGSGMMESNHSFEDENPFN